MTVREVINHLKLPKKVDLCWDDQIISFNFLNDIEKEVWGDYEVSYVYAAKECEFELTLATRLVKGVPA